MTANDQERMYRYLSWSHEDLTVALLQAEDDIKALEKLLNEANEERGQYYQESRSSAKILGGILRVMADNDMFLSGLGPLIREEELPDVAPALEAAARRPRRFVAAEPKQFHSYFKDTALGAECSCGAQWLRLAERCVTQPAAS